MTAASFFDNYFNLPKLMQSKKEYNAQMKRADALPKAYQYVFRKIQSHMWQFATGAGYDMMQAHEKLLCTFEKGAAEGRSVLEITGEDVAAFCDELLRSVQTSTENRRDAFNRDIIKKVRSLEKS